MGKYRFDKDDLNFVEDSRGLWGWIWVVVKYFCLSLVLAVLYYAVFSLFISTEQERELARETELMEVEYGKLHGRLQQLDNTIKNLQHRDREIYRSIFNAEPPVYSAYGDYDMFAGIDTTRIESVVEDSKMRLSVMERGMARVETTFEGIRGALDSLGSGVTAIPSIVPVKDFSIRQSGASVGKKINPFYKTVAIHNGMDLLAASGTPVLAGADGTVVKAVRNGRREGSSVTIDHGNGYVTVYNHLGKIRVRKGQRVKQGEEIAEVGLTGMSFAPHLHYEVWYKGKVMDPMDYFFSSITPQMYRDMAVVTANTGQSLD
ncbi:MAG: M23 family metallopeptidase [Bacteroidales bacterium]|nr:M23 family metallopeptidase [Bacteroidales bacterium]